MPEIEKIITVVSEWVNKAENDLKNAVYTLEMGEECPTDRVCFHAQQVVEKYLKALLVLNGIPFPTTWFPTRAITVWTGGEKPFPIPFFIPLS